jgi:hypothetical protein
MLVIPTEVARSATQRRDLLLLLNLFFCFLLVILSEAKDPSAAVLTTSAKKFLLTYRVPQVREANLGALTFANRPPQPP